MRVTGNDRGTMATLQKSAAGRKLLQEANKRGVKIQFKPDDGNTSMGQYNPNSNTITVEQGSLEKMVETLGHELVHATTPENGNSMNEETAAFIMGEKISSEAGVNANPHSQQYWQNHVNNAYSGLAQDNGILAKLYALGVDPAPGGATLGAGGGNQVAQNGGGNTGGTQAAYNPFGGNNTQASAAANPFGATANAGYGGNNAQVANPMGQMGQAGQGQMMGQFFQMMMQMLMQMMQTMMQMFQQQQQQNAQDPEKQKALSPISGTGFNFTA